jgi:putative hydrolase of the HAD superfamily
MTSFPDTRGLQYPPPDILPKAILFDLYDTLAYITPDAIQEGRRELARLAGVDPDAWAAAWRANAMERMLGTLGDMGQTLKTMLVALGADPPPELIADLVLRENRAWAESVKLYPEALPTLRELRRRGYRLGLVSNCSCQAGAVVGALGLAELLDVTVLSCDVGVAKPDPAIFRHASDGLGLEPAACMFVADGAFTELDAAKALGMIAVKIEQANQSGNYGTSTSFDHRITSLVQVFDLLADPS